MKLHPVATLASLLLVSLHLTSGCSSQTTVGSNPEYKKGDLAGDHLGIIFAGNIHFKNHLEADERESQQRLAFNEIVRSSHATLRGVEVIAKKFSWSSPANGPGRAFSVTRQVPGSKDPIVFIIPTRTDILEMDKDIDIALILDDMTYLSETFVKKAGADGKWLPSEEAGAVWVPGTQDKVERNSSIDAKFILWNYKRAEAITWGRVSMKKTDVDLEQIFGLLAKQIFRKTPLN